MILIKVSPHSTTPAKSYAPELKSLPSHMPCFPLSLPCSPQQITNSKHPKKHKKEMNRQQL